MSTRRHNLKRLPLVAAVAACLYTTTVFAQDPASTADQETESQPQTQSATELEKITVTGSLLRRTEYESTSPIQVITADTNISLGQVAAAEFLQKSSVAAGSTQINHQFSGFVTEGGTGAQTLALRGMAASRTLILLDGQRPGPAGTRGQVGAFDLNVIPSSILQRAEIVKDGSSSIYGSDAVAGVVNLITRKNIDRPEVTATMRVPFEGGGEIFQVSGANGWNFDNGSIVAAAEYYLHEPLLQGDRDYLRCAQDMAFDGPNGNRIDREDRSILAGTPLAGCSATNLYANTVIDAVFGTRWVPSPDGSTIGMIPGYIPRPSPLPNYANSGEAWFIDVLNFPFMDSQQIIDKQEKISAFASADFALGSVNWRTQFLYNHRETETHRYRQFFPLIGGSTALIPGYGYANSPDYFAPVDSGIAQPIMPFSSDQKIEVDYYYLTTKFDGLLGFTDTWAWEANASYSRSDGDYSNLSIVASRSGDVQFDDNAPVLDYFSPDFLSGRRMKDLEAQVGQWHTGNTLYQQTVVNALVTGEMFQMPAGAAAAAIGLEFRDYSIDDQPSALSTGGDLWGQSSAQVTKGNDQVVEALVEMEFPLLKGKPGFESLTFNTSGRIFDYDSLDGTDHVWKAGLNWQVNSALRLRATRGTSFRAPGLYELYLGDQTGFASQLSIDPCILWGESNNDFIKANCAAAGIPDDYTGAASSATIVSGGGAGFLVPETSKAFTAGIVFTPSFANLSIAVDYFDYDVRKQIGQLATSSILGGCYGSPIYPNTFCDLFDRNPGNHPTDPFKIETVYNTYINIDQQQVKGYDLIVNYDNDFSFGKLAVETQLTYTKEDISQLFDTAEASGFSTSDRVGEIGRPKLVGNMDVRLERGDWTYYWGVEYIHGTKNLDLDSTFTYQGWADAWRDIRADRRFYHNASVRYDLDDWSVLVGVRNIFDKDPPFISNGVGTRYGNIPAFATQYDLYGRTGFVRVQYKF